MANRPAPEVAIDEELVRALLRRQHPSMAALELVQVARGWDNTNFRLGDRHLVRLPHRALAAPLIRHEQLWLPVLAQFVDLALPVPTHVGEPDERFPWHWSIIPWFDGQVAATAELADPAAAAAELGRFLAQLHRPAPVDAPVNPYRGVGLASRQESFRTNLERAGSAVDADGLAAIFDDALDAPENPEAVWLHGDLHTRNMIVTGGRIRAIIDWGDVCRGHRSVDLASAYMLVPNHVVIVREHAGATDADWRCARGWAVHFGLVYRAMSDDDPVMAGIGDRLLTTLLRLPTTTAVRDAFAVHGGAEVAFPHPSHLDTQETPMVGTMIEFPVNGTSAGGYLALPDGGAGAGVIVLQEWWGLVPQIKGVCDRLAAAGYTALAPDLYHGEMAEHTEMDKAGALMTSLPPERAAKDMLGAIDALLSHDACSSDSVGVIGFCMGGMLTLRLCALAGDKVSVAAPFYGAPLGDDSIDWSGLTAKIEGHFAANDDFFPPDAVEALAARLRGLGKDVVFHVYPGTGHGFTNEENPMGSFNEHASEASWSRTMALLATIS